MSNMRSTTVLSIRAYSDDLERWNKVTGWHLRKFENKNTGLIRIGLRVYLKDKQRWSKIVKIAAIKDKIAADVFKEMLDLVERKRLQSQLRRKKVADIFRYLLDLYEREMLLWKRLEI